MLSPETSGQHPSAKFALSAAEGMGVILSPAHPEFPLLSS